MKGGLYTGQHSLRQNECEVSASLVPPFTDSQRKLRRRSAKIPRRRLAAGGATALLRPQPLRPPASETSNPPPPITQSSHGRRTAALKNGGQSFPFDPPILAGSDRARAMGFLNMRAKYKPQLKQPGIAGVLQMVRMNRDFLFLFVFSLSLSAI